MRAQRFMGLLQETRPGWESGPKTLCALALCRPGQAPGRPAGLRDPKKGRFLHFSERSRLDWPVYVVLVSRRGASLGVVVRGRGGLPWGVVSGRGGFPRGRGQQAGRGPPSGLWSAGGASGCLCPAVPSGEEWLMGMKAESAVTEGTELGLWRGCQELMARCCQQEQGLWAAGAPCPPSSPPPTLGTRPSRGSATWFPLGVSVCRLGCTRPVRPPEHSLPSECATGV